MVSSRSGTRAITKAKHNGNRNNGRGSEYSKSEHKGQTSNDINKTHDEFIQGKGSTKHKSDASKSTRVKAHKVAEAMVLSRSCNKSHHKAKHNGIRTNGRSPTQNQVLPGKDQRQV